MKFSFKRGIIFKAAAKNAGQNFGPQILKAGNPG